MACHQSVKDGPEQLPSNIFGGTVVAEDNFRGVVAIGELHCTGTLISRNEVITAAHCVVDDPSQMDGPNIKNFSHTIRIGSGGAAGYAKTYRARQVTVHPKYNFGNAAHNNYDIAYIRLTKDVQLKDAEIHPFATAKEIAALKNADLITLVGFGRDESGEGGEKKITTTRFHHHGGMELYLGGQGSSVCFGDSGGPAFIDRGGQFKLVGITSRLNSQFMDIQNACRDEGIFANAEEGRNLVESERLIAQNKLYLSEILYPEASWASYWRVQKNKKDQKNLLLLAKLLPWSTQIGKLVDKAGISLAEKQSAQATGFYNKAMYDLALEPLIELLDTQEISAQNLYKLARILAQKGTDTVARKLIELGKMRYPNNELFYELDAEMELARHNHGIAKDILTQIPVRKENIILHINQMVLAKEWDQALELARQAKELGGDFDYITLAVDNILGIALKWGAFELADFLLDQEIDLNLKKSSGGMINTLASHNQYLLMEKMLQKGANPDAPDNQYGVAALHVAATNNKLENIKLLIKYGANPKLRTAFGQTASDLAHQKGYQEIVDYLDRK